MATQYAGTGTPQNPSMSVITHKDPLFKAKSDLLDTYLDLELFSRAALQKGLFRNEEACYFGQVFKKSRQEAAKELVLFLFQSDQKTLFLDVLTRSVEMGEEDGVAAQRVKGHAVLLKEWTLLEEQQQQSTNVTTSKKTRWRWPRSRHQHKTQAQPPDPDTASKEHTPVSTPLQADVQPPDHHYRKQLSVSHIATADEEAASLNTESGFGSMSGLSTATELSRGFRNSLASVSTETSLGSPTASSPSMRWWRRNVARGRGFKPHHASLPSFFDSGNDVWPIHKSQRRASADNVLEATTGSQSRLVGTQYTRIKGEDENAALTKVDLLNLERRILAAFDDLKASSTETLKNEEHIAAKEIPTGPTLSLEKKAPLQQKLPPVYFPLPNSEDHVADLLQHCWFPSGIQQVELSPSGGTYQLGSPDASLEVPHGAIAEKTTVQFGLALHGSFIVPSGYCQASVSIYLFFEDKATLTKAVTLHLRHWCLGSKLKFAKSSHDLEEGDTTYRFEVVESGVFHEQKCIGSLQIEQPQTIYTILMEEGEQTLCYTMLLQEQALRRDNQQFVLLVLYFSQEWIKTLLDVYCTDHSWVGKPSNRCEFEFGEEQIRVVLSRDKGSGWTVHSIYPSSVIKRSKLSLKNFNNGDALENAVRNFTYPGRLYCKVIFTHPSRQRTRLADVVLQFKGTSPDDLNFPLEFYEEEEELQLAIGKFDSLPSGFSSGCGTSIRSSVSSNESFSIYKRRSREVSSADVPIDPRLMGKPTLPQLNQHIVMKLAEDWKPFCLYLLDDSAAVSQAETDCKTVREKCLEALIRWQKGQGKKRTWQAIVQGLYNVGQVDYAKELTEKIVRGNI